MQVRDIQTDEDGNVKCPVCGRTWRTADNADINPCDHLRFVWNEQSVPTYFGKWKHGPFTKEYLRLYRKENDDEATRGDALENPDHNVFRKMLPLPDLTHIYSVTETGIACGPVSFTTYFGVLHNDYRYGNERLRLKILSCRTCELYGKKVDIHVTAERNKTTFILDIFNSRIKNPDKDYITTHEVEGSWNDVLEQAVTFDD